MGQIGAAELAAAFRAGGLVDGAASGGERRSLSAALLRRCCRALAGETDPRGIRLVGATITGQLDLAGLEVRFPLRFEDCVFATALVVEGAELFSLTLTGCALPGLLGNGVRIRRDLDLSRSQLTGHIGPARDLADLGGLAL